MCSPGMLESSTECAGEVGRLHEEFTKRGVKVLALSSNDVSSHKGCALD